MAASITLVGGPTALIEVDGLTILTDPTFDAPGEYPIPGGVLVKTAGPAIAASDLPAIDIVTLSHAHHPDNLDASGAEIVAGAKKAVGTPMAQSQIASVTALEPWSSTTVTAPNGRDFVVTAVPARHGPVGCEEITGDVSGFIIESDASPTIYISGDNAAVEYIDDIVARFAHIDIALLFTGAARVGLFDNAPLTLTAEMAATVASKMPHATIFPVHSEGWAHFSEDRELLVEAFATADLSSRLVLAAPGQKVAV